MGSTTEEKGEKSFSTTSRQSNAIKMRETLSSAQVGLLTVFLLAYKFISAIKPLQRHIIRFTHRHFVMEISFAVFSLTVELSAHFISRDVSRVEINLSFMIYSPM